MVRTSAIGGILLLLPFLSGCGVEHEKIHGTWVVEDGPAATPKGMVWEFTSDGKLSCELQTEVQTVITKDLVWSITGNRLAIKLSDSEGRARIKELTDTRLVLKDDEHLKETVFKKVK